MAITPKGQIKREGRISFHDASLHIMEDGLNSRMTTTERDAWKAAFKRDVFKRIVQTLNRLGWTVGPQHYIFTSNDNRFCTKGDLKADLKLSGRCIDLEFFQSVNCPTRPDHEGRYESNKAKCMPYVLRLEMIRTRQRIADYLCAVFTGYTLKPKRINSPNPDPLAYFNDGWDSEHEKARGTHRFKRGSDGWPDDSELGSWNREDKDGAILRHGDVRWRRDHKGRLMRGRVYGGINQMWMFVYGPGERDHTQAHANDFFTYSAGVTPRKVIDERARRKRLEGELQIAINTMNFSRAEVLKGLLFPSNARLFHILKNGGYFRPGSEGYTKEKKEAGKFTADELKDYAGGFESGELKAIPAEA